MRKGTKGIRKVSTGTNEYYVYDLDENVFGKRKRLYAKTEGELKKKIKDAEHERDMLLSACKPKKNALADYVRYYFKNAIGNIPSRKIRQLIILFERTVFGSEIDRDISTIQEKNLQDFYDILIEKFPLESVKNIDAILRKTFELSNQEGITNFDFKQVTVPEKNAQEVIINYILSPEEFKNMLSFCIADNCTRYGKNELLIVFCMMTGLKLSTIKTLTIKDFDLEKGTVYAEGKTYYLSEKCVSWLEQQASDGAISLPVVTTDSENMDSENTDSDEGIGIARYTYMQDTVVFTNSHGTSPTLQSIQSTLSAVTKRCGLPKGVTGKTLCKSYVISELENGTTVEQLCERLHYKKRRSVIDIQDEYEIRKALF